MANTFFSIFQRIFQQTIRPTHPCKTTEWILMLNSTPEMLGLNREVMLEIYVSFLNCKSKTRVILKYLAKKWKGNSALHSHHWPWTIWDTCSPCSQKPACDLWLPQNKLLRAYCWLEAFPLVNSRLTHILCVIYILFTVFLQQSKLEKRNCY